MGRIDISPEALFALPTLAEMGVRPEILEAAEACCVSTEGGAIEKGPLEILVRLIAFHVLRDACRRCGPKARPALACREVRHG